MSNIYKGEMQDYEGNTIYPHTASDVVFCPDGETVQQKLSKAETTLDNITGVSDSTELDDGTKLATSKAVNALRENVNSSLGGLSFAQDENGKWGYKVGADAVIPFSGNFQLDIVIQVQGYNYAGVQASANATVTIKYVDDKITYTPTNIFANSSYNVWQGDQTWTGQRAQIISVTYKKL